MGRRSRQRTATPSAAAPPPSVAAPGRRERAPSAPWGAFPLIELCALAAIVLGVWGLLRHDRTGGMLLTAAALLGSVAGLEISIREHLGGYRSHTLVLSGTCAAVTLALLVFAQLDRIAMLTIAAAVLLVALVGFALLFRRRSGGQVFRVR